MSDPLSDAESLPTKSWSSLSSPPTDMSEAESPVSSLKSVGARARMLRRRRREKNVPVEKDSEE